MTTSAMQRSGNASICRPSAQSTVSFTGHGGNRVVLDYAGSLEPVVEAGGVVTLAPRDTERQRCASACDERRHRARGPLFSPSAAPPSGPAHRAPKRSNRTNRL